jgi:HEAT repeat protein
MFVKRHWFARCVAAGLALAATSGYAQSKSAVQAESAQMAAGWSALNQGNADRAASIASGVLSQNPRSRPALVLLVTAATTRGGSTDGLAVYERWLGTRRLDDGYTLRTIALAMLQEAASNRAAPDGQREAVKALAAEGDRETLLAVARSASTGGLFETQLLAQLGSESAVKSLIAQVKSGPGPTRLMLIGALASSGSPLAVRPLEDLLKELNPDVRAAAADALGKLGAAEAVDALRPLLDDKVFPVRFAAASALMRLNDTSGLSLLHDLQTSEHAMVRVSALEALSVDPNPAWISSVLGLLQDPDPQVRLAAAKLAAPFDLAAAQSVIEGLARDGNIAIREAASKVYVEQVASDFGVLRRFLHASDLVSRVRAAGRILALTR